MSGSIRLSPKHGVNPSMGVCFFCGEDDGTIILPGRLKDDAEAPRRACWTKEPCAKCKDLMKQGIMLIEATGDAENPYRTGRVWVIKEGAAQSIFGEEVIKKRCAFIEPEVAKKIGLSE